MGSQGTPDLIAKKGDEIILIEVIDRSKTESAIVDQLERYTNWEKNYSGSTY
jgi:Holliday junction resolvase